MSELTFWAKALDPNAVSEHYQVLLSCNGPDLANFTEILWEETFTDTAWHQVTIDLTYYSEMCVYIAWNHTQVTNMQGFLIDDVSITETLTDAASRDFVNYNVYRDGSLIGTADFTTYLDENLPDGTYSYYVTAQYDDGESNPSNTVDVIISSVAYDEGFEDGIPDTWMVLNADNHYEKWHASAVEAHSGEKSAMCSTMGNNDDWLITPPLDITADVVDDFSFFIRTYADDFIDEWELLISTTVPEPDAFTDMLDSGDGYLGNFVQKSYNLDNYDGETIYVAFHYISTDGWAIYVDDVNLPTVHTFENDIMIKSLTGPGLNTMYMEEAYTVTIKNMGSYPQMDYSVSLVDQLGQVAATASGDFLIPGQETTLTIPWMPEAMGSFEMQAVINLTTDENPYNDTSLVLPVSVMDESAQLCTLGNGTTYTEDLPLNILWNNSISEVIFMSDELADANVLPGSISAIAFDYRFEIDVQDIAAQFWMGETDLTDLSAGWITADQLHPVSVASINFFEGDHHKAVITFDQPVDYDGGNLVLMTHRIYEDGIHPGMNFYYYTETPAYPNRCATFYSDDVVIDPNDPPVQGNGGLYARHPNITFITEAAGGMMPPANLSAMVVDSDVILNWDAPAGNVLGYNLFRNGDQVNSDLITNTNYIDAGLAAGWYTYWAVAVYPEGTSEPSEVVEVEIEGTSSPEQLPAVTTLVGNYPNPFNPSTTISYSLQAEQPVTIDVFNARGERVTTLVDGVKPAGNHQIEWRGQDASGKKVSSGIYFYRMRTTRFSRTYKMLLLQ
jgi:hypothetical protein